MTIRLGTLFGMGQHGLSSTRWKGSSESVLSNGNGIFKRAALVASEFYMKLSEFHESLHEKMTVISLGEALSPNPLPEAKMPNSMGPLIH